MTVVERFPRAVREIENCWIALSDGCRLAARIWLPRDAADDPVPAILEYIPYRKRDGTAERDELTHPYFAGHGYACVRLDMRGNGESDGLMRDEYLKQEQDDALEAIDWIARQPWCDGNVGMIGISWGGFNGLQVAARRPKALKAVVTVCSTDDRYADDVHYMGGCLLVENFGWASTMLAFSSRPPDPALVGKRWREMWLDRLENMPLLIETWLRHQRRDAYWKHGSVCEDFAAIEAAVFAVGGWADAYSNVVPRLVAGLAAPVKGLVGPWIHRYPHFATPRPAIGFLQECLRWWDHWLKNVDTGVMDEPAYRVYMQDGVAPRASYDERPGRWIAEPAWPSPGIEIRSLAINRDGLAPEAGPEQALTLRSPQTTGIAGGCFCAMRGGPELPTDQREDDAGSLTFDTAPLAELLEILGAPEVDLEVAVDRPCALIAVRLSDVSPGGAATRVSYGLLNLTHRDSHEHPSPVEPGRRYRLRIRLNDAAHAFAPGHRLRLAVSTAYWPIAWPSPEPVILTLFAGASRLELPVRAPRGDQLRRFEDAETAPPVDLEILQPKRKSRTTERDTATGETVVRVEDDSGEKRFASHGLVTRSVVRETYRILADDPLSARAVAHWTMTLGRGDWRVRTECRSTIWCDRESFHVHAELDAFEGAEKAFERHWDVTVPRDLV